MNTSKRRKTKERKAEKRAMGSSKVCGTRFASVAAERERKLNHKLGDICIRPITFPEKTPASEQAKNPNKFLPL